MSDLVSKQQRLRYFSDNDLPDREFINIFNGAKYKKKKNGTF